MGYYSSIDGQIHGISKESYEKVEGLMTEHFDDFEYREEFNSIWIHSYGKHYEIEEVLTAISEQIQEEFYGELSYVGEEDGHLITFFLKAGEWCELPVKIVYPENPYLSKTTTKTGETL